jgi:sugar phosphate isomerase/epimerase
MMSMPSLSLCPLTIMRAPHRELVEAAHVGGFGAVGFRVIPPRPVDTVHPLVGDAKAIKELGGVMADLGIKLFDVETCWMSAVTEPRSLEPSLEAAAMLGASHLLVAGNDPEWDRMVATFAAIAKLAAGYRIKVGLEPTSFCVLRSLQRACDLLRQAGSDNAGILVDTLHMARAGETPASLAALDPRLVAYVQICDARKETPASPAELMAEARSDRLLPGEGELPLNEMLDALPDGLHVGVEAPTREFATLPFADCARRAGEATRAFFAARKARKPS